MSRDIKPSTVDKVVGRITTTSNVSVDQAKKIAVESAERINRERQEKKR